VEKLEREKQELEKLRHREIRKHENKIKELERQHETEITECKTRIRGWAGHILRIVSTISSPHSAMPP
jgi:phage-related minor tail protein